MRRARTRRARSNVGVMPLLWSYTDAELRAVYERLPTRFLRHELDKLLGQPDPTWPEWTEGPEQIARTVPIVQGVLARRAARLPRLRAWR